MTSTRSKISLVIGIALASATVVLGLVIACDFSGVPHPARDRVVHSLTWASVLWNLGFVIAARRSRLRN